MQIRRGVFMTALLTAVLALILTGTPGVAFGMKVIIGTINTELADTTTVGTIYNALITPGVGSILINSGSILGDDCILSGQSCTTVLPIAAGPYPNPTTGLPPVFTVFGTTGTATATKTSGSINKVTLNNLTIQVAQPVTLVILYFHVFTGIDESVQRAYGQAASGSLCRPVAGQCQTAVNDAVRLNSAVVYAKNSGNLGDPVGCLNAGLCALANVPQSRNNAPYKVGVDGGNDYFPESTFPTTTTTAQCPFSGACQSAELIASALTINFTQGLDTVIQKATHLNVSGPTEGDVERTIHAEAVMFDVQPLPSPAPTPLLDLSNNDINLTQTGGNAKRQVVLISQVDSNGVPVFDPRTATGVQLAVGDGEKVNPVGGVTHPDINLDGIPDTVYTFRIADLAKTGTCTANGFPAGVAILTGDAEFTSVTVTQQPAPHGNKPLPPNCVLDLGGSTMTCTTTVTEKLPFSGAESITCSPSAGGN